MTVAETRTIVAADGEDIVVETIRAMATAKDVHHTDLDVAIGDILDPDALARLFTTDSPAPQHGVSVTVSIDGFHVTLRMHDAREITIEVSMPADAPTPRDPHAGDDARTTGDAGT